VQFSKNNKFGYIVFPRLLSRASLFTYVSLSRMRPHEHVPPRKRLTNVRVCTRQSTLPKFFFLLRVGFERLRAKGIGGRKNFLPAQCATRTRLLESKNFECEGL